MLCCPFLENRPPLTPSIFAASMHRDPWDSDEIQIVATIVNHLTLRGHIGLEGRHGPASHGPDVLAGEVSERLLQIADANGSRK